MVAHVGPSPYPNLQANSRSKMRCGSSITEATFEIGSLNQFWTGKDRTDFKTGPSVEWIRVVLIDHGWRRAWSNPIWLDDL